MRLAICFIVLLGVSLMNSYSAGPDTTASKGFLLVANKGDHALGIIDPQAGRQIATVPESGITGHEVTASPDGKFAYVPVYGDSGVGAPGTDGRTMDVIDISARRVVATIDFGRPVRPHCAMFGPKDGLLYVSTELTNSIDVIDPRTHKIVGQIPTGAPESHMFILSRDGRRAYTSNVHPGSVSAIDLAARKVDAVIPISAKSQRIALSADDRYAFTADQMKPQLAVIDTASNAIARWIPLPGVAYGTAATPDGRWLLVTLPKAEQVAVIDLNAMKVVRSIDVPKFPQEIVVRPDSRMAYVSCDESAKVVAIDLKTWKVEKLIEAGAKADGLAWAGKN